LTEALNKFAWYDRLGYAPGPGQRAFHESDARTKVACCPARSGKSFSAALDVEPYILLPNTRGWIVGPSYELGEKEFRYIYDHLVMQGPSLGIPRPVNKIYNIKGGDMYLKFPWGSEVRVKSADNPSSLLGEELDWVIMSEAAQTRGDIYERYIDARLRIRRGRAIIPTTPQMGADWVWRYWELGNQSNDVGVESFNWGVEENPSYPMEEFDHAKSLVDAGVMSEEAFREQFLGEWVLYTGAVFKVFRPKTHVVRPFAIPPDWPRFRAIDFGARDPFCCLWFALSPSSQIFVYREYYETGEPSTKEHAERILEMSAGEEYVFSVADRSGAQLRIDLAGYGVPTIPSASDPDSKKVARARISEYLAPHPDTGKPSVFFFETCVNVIREMKLLRWKESTGVEGNREATVGDDHAVDPLGYFLMKRPRPVVTRKVVPMNSFDSWKRRLRKERMRERMTLGVP
jgi:hypothetical protein